ncbi:MAG: nucleoside 2-deoxyribosyltransferase [Pseudolabrys sp.]
MNPSPLIYLAGPGIFRKDAEQYGAELKRQCRAFGFWGFWPGDIDVKGLTPIQAAHTIRQGCINMILRCNAVIADISPFRGIHMDTGTADECGRADMIGKPIFAWSDDRRELADRTLGHFFPTDNGQVSDYAKQNGFTDYSNKNPIR